MSEIAIIMPTYHRPISLKIAIDSVVAQSFKDWKLYVIGDGCTDGTKDIVASYQSKTPNKIVWKNLKDNHGGGHFRHLKGDSGAACRNTAFHISKEPYIAYLDDDDRYYDIHLDLLYKTIKHGYDFVYSVGKFIHAQGRMAKPQLIGTEPPQYQGLGTNAIMHTRAIANKVLFPLKHPEGDMKKGLWKSSKEAWACHDWELVQRFLKIGGKWRFINTPTYEAYWGFQNSDFARMVRTPRFQK